ncbi:DUF1671-domain-containing protein [Wolfiporia cocos MD-104 SS10]|uniref:DUF1671-domain-containing protein n=1 Tax=Wolfiporia cocos (strain MD-104) TaxID=742152 RepID=A0A2H3J8N0_WOLCO|nr:DUF1671-domain-containing protein [Wolfiporia cocos MD-104 SS10]
MSGQTVCQFCTEDLTDRTLQQRQAHYDEHFSSRHAITSTSSQSTDVPARHGLKAWFAPYVPNSGNPETQNIFWYPSQTHPPSRNFSPGLIPMTKRALAKSRERGKTQRAWLCHEQTVHINSEAFDRTWGCGYRNFMMVCTALMVQQQQPMYYPLLDHPTPPGVRNLQACIEEAWAKGYDEEGAKQLKCRLTGTGKYIGTGELYVAFTYRGIPAQLVDFELNDGVEPLLNWVLRHFSADESPKPTTLDEALRGTNAIVITDKMPLILQHDGHSRTVVGCERCSDGNINLLVFDPSRYIPQDIWDAGLAVHNSQMAESLRSHRNSVSSIMHDALHPVQTIRSHKRKADAESEGETAKKPRASMDAQDGDQTTPTRNNVAQDNVQRDPDWSKVLNIVRLSASMLRKKRRYQILYFPLTEPLTESERWARRELTCVKIG